MSAYRISSPPPVDPSLTEQDPFPTIACRCCRRPTVSMGGEDLCARCDYRELVRRDACCGPIWG